MGSDMGYMRGDMGGPMADKDCSCSHRERCCVGMETGAWAALNGGGGAKNVYVLVMHGTKTGNTVRDVRLPRLPNAVLRSDAL